MVIGVTGHNGFIGSHLVKFLQEKGHVVLVTSDDLRLQKRANRFVKQCQYIFHMAADMGGVGYFSQNKYNPIANNLQLDINVLRACEKYHVPLFYPSSACIYPTSAMNKGVPLSENLIEQPAEPDQLYGFEKLMMTKLAMASPHRVRVGIFHTIYGEGQAYKGEKAKFPPQIAYKVAMAKATNEDVRVWGSGKQERTFLYITDALEMIYEVAFSEHYEGPVNISYPDSVTIKECVDLLCSQADIPGKYLFTGENEGVTKRSVDMTKYFALYNYRPKVMPVAGFTRIYRYVCKDLGY